MDAVAAGRALARLSRVIERAVAAGDLTLAQYRVLVLAAERPQRASALAAQADVKRPTLSAVVHGLERAGMLNRASVADDGRGVQLSLTEHGRHALSQAEAEMGAQLAVMADAGGVRLEELKSGLAGLLTGFETLNRLPGECDRA
ncbi:MAG: MarR family winged helix-turn-helix transcriptional regulator [Solirubrobacteraceae bacterium]